MKTDDKGNPDPLGEQLEQRGVIVETMSFNVKYRLSDENTRVHEAFKQFAFDKTKGNYLEAIQVLLENFDEDWKYRGLDQRLSSIEESIDDMKKRDKPVVAKRFGVRIGDEA